MNKLKLIALSLIAGGTLFAQQTAPISGGGPIGPNPTTPIAPSNQTLLLFQLVSIDPTAGAPCYNYSYDQFNYVSQTGWGCVAPPGSVPGTVVPTWRVIFGGFGLQAGAGPTLTGATIAPTFRNQAFNGTTALVTITPPPSVAAGATFTVTFTGSGSGLTWTAAGNIAVAGTATTANTSVTFSWDAVQSKWIPSRIS